MVEPRRVASSRSSRSTVPHELHRLQSQQDGLHARVSELRCALDDKELLLKSQANTIKLYEFKFTQLTEQNAALRKTIAVLSEYITGKLRAQLPDLPELPLEQGLKREDFATVASVGRKHKRRKSPQKTVSRSFTSMQEMHTCPHAFADFAGAEFLKALLEAQTNRKMFQNSPFSHLSGKSKEILLQPTQTALFETLSFFLTCRNVAFLNNFDIFFPRVLQMLVDILEVDQVTLYEKNPANGLLYCRATTGFCRYQQELEPSFGHFETLFRKKGTVVIGNAQEDGSFDKDYQRIVGVAVKNLASVPMSVGEDVFGVLECINKKRAFAPSDLVVLNQVAKQLSVGMMGAQVKSKVQRLVSKGSRLLESIDSAQDALLMPLLHTQLAAAVAALRCERATLFAYDPATHELVSLLGTALDGVIKVPLTKSIASAAFNSTKVVNVERAEDHPEFLRSIDEATGFKTKEILAVAVGSQGVLECMNTMTGSAFTESDVEVAKAVAQSLNTLLDTMKNLSGILLESDLSEIALQHLTVACLHLNPKALISKVNRFACDFFSLAPERLVGMALSELLEPTPKILSKLLSAFDSAEPTTISSVAICTSRDDLRRRKEALANLTLIPVTGRAPGYILLLYPINPL